MHKSYYLIPNDASNRIVVRIGGSHSQKTEASRQRGGVYPVMQRGNGGQDIFSTGNSSWTSLIMRFCKPDRVFVFTVLYSKTAGDYLQKAKNRIAEISQWGLMPIIERDFPEGVS